MISWGNLSGLFSLGYSIHWDSLPRTTHLGQHHLPICHYLGTLLVFGDQVALFHDFCLISLDKWDARAANECLSKLAGRLLGFCGTGNTKNVGAACLSMAAARLRPRPLNGCKVSVRAAALMR